MDAWYKSFVETTDLSKISFVKQAICNAYDENELNKTMLTEIEQISKQNNELKNSFEQQTNKSRGIGAVHFLTQIRWLFWREFLNQSRSQIATYLYIGQALVSGFCLFVSK